MKSNGRLLILCLISLLSGAVGSGIYFFEMQRRGETDVAHFHPPAADQGPARLAEYQRFAMRHPEMYSSAAGAAKATSSIQTEIDYAPPRKPVLGVYNRTQYLLRLNAFAAQVLRSAVQDEKSFRSPINTALALETREVADLSQILLTKIDEVSAGFDSLPEEERTRTLRDLDRQAQELSDLVAKWQQDKKATVNGAGTPEQPRR
jgi:hypothetical protein